MKQFTNGRVTRPVHDLLDLAILLAGGWYVRTTCDSADPSTKLIGPALPAHEVVAHEMGHATHRTGRLLFC